MHGFPVHGIWQEAIQANASHCKKNQQTFFSFLTILIKKTNPPTNKVGKLFTITSGSTMQNQIVKYADF